VRTSIVHCKQRRRQEAQLLNRDAAYKMLHPWSRWIPKLSQPFIPPGQIIVRAKIVRLRSAITFSCLKVPYKCRQFLRTIPSLPGNSIHGLPKFSLFCVNWF